MVANLRDRNDIEMLNINKKNSRNNKMEIK